MILSVVNSEAGIMDISKSPSTEHKIAIYGARLSEDIKIEYPYSTMCYIMSQVLTSEGHLWNPREEEMGEG